MNKKYKIIGSIFFSTYRIIRERANNGGGKSGKYARN